MAYSDSTMVHSILAMAQANLKTLEDLRAKMKTLLEESNLHAQQQRERDGILALSSVEPMDLPPEMFEEPINCGEEVDTGTLEKLMMELHTVMHKKPTDCGGESEDFEAIEVEDTEI